MTTCCFCVSTTAYLIQSSIQRSDSARQKKYPNGILRFGHKKRRILAMEDLSESTLALAARKSCNLLRATCINNNKTRTKSCYVSYEWVDEWCQVKRQAIYLKCFFSVENFSIKSLPHFVIQNYRKNAIKPWLWLCEAFNGRILSSPSYDARICGWRWSRNGFTDLSAITINTVFDK